jgi:small-conductance mechanosensitive channel
VTGTKQLSRSPLRTRRKNTWPFAAQTAGKSGNDGPIVSLIGYWLGVNVRNKCFVLGRRHQLTFGLAIALTLAGSTVPLPADAAVHDVTPAKPSTRVVPIKFWNRVIVLQRATLAGADPEDRAARASERLAGLPLNASPGDVVTRPFKIDDQEGVGFVFRDRLLFFLGTNDLDKESGEKLEQASESALRNVREALDARAAERSWPIVRAGLLYTLAGFVVLVILCIAVWKAQTFVTTFLRRRGEVASWRLFGIDLLPHIVATVGGLLRTLAHVFTVFLIYLWVTLSFRRFPYTAPWGEQAGGYVLNSIRELGNTVIRGLPGLLVVIVIFLLTRWIVRMANAVFDQVATGKIAVSWMDADVARATHRIFSAIVWIFAIIIAYPYIPGSRTEAFKGLSIFIGLVISLGSTGIINQIMSGLFAVYARALKTGEWVRIDETEGEVLDVGLLAAKIRTIEGQEVTIPNSMLVSTPATNFTRLGDADGMTVSSKVTIGYGAPWRQVHALLELAASRTPNIRKTPKPRVVQKQLSDFYVEYTLVARLDDEKLRVETVSNLHSAIQDAFNEFGVQIMSPHYMIQPNGSVIVPRERWDAAPSPSLPRKPRKADDPSSSDE